MRSSYKKIGPYIRQIDVRNIEDKKNNLLGVSTKKVFIDSIANTNGTDFKTYKIVKRRQFTYVADTSRRGDRIGIALLETHDEGLVSPIYTVFEIIDQTALIPEYLMMWFRRPEFDRYARFKSHGSVRELFSWEEMCEVELPVPSPEKQREIVRKYGTIVNRIHLSERLIQNLKETAEAIYKRWFVDFEFPISAGYAAAIGKPEIEGLPYKSNGGEMVFSGVADRFIPRGWKMGSWSDVSTLFSGFAFAGDKYSSDMGLSVVRGENVSEQKLRWDTHKKWDSKLPKRAESCYLKDMDILIGMDGSKVGKNWVMISKYDIPLVLAQRVACVRANDPTWQTFLYFSMFSQRFENYVAQVTTGTSVPHISGKQIMAFPSVIPLSDIVERFNTILIPAINKIRYINAETDFLKTMKGIILSKISSI